MLKCLLFLTGLLVAGCTSAMAQGTGVIQVTVTPNASAYTAGMCLGGILTIPQQIRPGGPGGTIMTQLDIVDPTGSNATMDIWIFNALPTGTYTDHANCGIASGDVSKVIGVMFGANLTCVKDQPTTTGICQSSPAVLAGPAVQPPQASTLWAVPIMTGTPTYGSSKTLYFYFKGFPD